MFQRLKQYLVRRSFRAGSQQTFLEGLAFWLERESNLSAALHQLIAHTPRRMTQLFITLIQKHLAAKETFSEAMRPYYPNYVIEMLRTGESDGHLSKAVRAAAEAFAIQHITFRAIFRGLLYPAVILCAAAGLAGSIHDTVFRDLSSLQPLMSWPWIGKVAYSVSGFIQRFGWMVLSVGVILAASGMYILRKQLLTPQVFTFLKPIKGRRRMHDFLHQVQETMHESALEIQAVGSVIGNTLLGIGAVLAILLICAMYGVGIG